MTKNDALKIINNSENKDNISQNVWKLTLDKERYNILWKEGTERPFTGKLLYEKRNGTFVSYGCKIPVFLSEDKYDSKTG